VADDLLAASLAVVGFVFGPNDVAAQVGAAVFNLDASAALVVNPYPVRIIGNGPCRSPHQTRPQQTRYENRCKAHGYLLSCKQNSLVRRAVHICANVLVFKGNASHTS